MTVTQLGNLSADWRVEPLGNLASEQTDRNPNLRFTRDDVLTVDNQLGLIRSDRKLGDDFSRYKIVGEHSFAYNPMRLNVGSIGLWEKPEQAIVSPDYIVFECNREKLLPQFLDFFRRTHAWRSQIQQSGQGSIRIRYYFRHIAEFVIPVPSLSEQRTVAHVLRTVQRAKEETEKVIASTRQLKQSLMRHLFTYGPVPFDQADRVKLQETELGTVPEQWCRATLGELCTFRDGTIQTGPFGSQLHKADYMDSGVPVVNPTHLLGNRINHVNLPRITTVKASELARHRLRHGDVLFARRGEIGRHRFVTQAEEGWLCGTGCFLVRVSHPEIFNAFLPWYFSQTSVVEWLEANAAGAIMPNLNNTTLARLPVFYPTLPEQCQIAAQLAAVDAKLAAEETRCDALDALFQSLLHHLMTGKVRVHDLELPSMKEAAQ